MTWILLGVNALLVFGAVSSDEVQIGGGVGSVHKNAPYVIQQYYGMMSLICLLMTTAFMNATANRDFQYNMYQLIFSSPVKKSHYFFGKFIGAVTVAMIPILGVSLGSLIGPLMPWTEAERYGPVIWSGHLSGLLTFGIPNIFITGVLLFSLALIFRSNIVSFVGAMLILVLYAVSSGFTRDIQNEWIANVLDPFGFRPASILSKYMTVDEKNLHPAPVSGPLLMNRLLWMGISLVLLFVLYWRFSFSTKKEKRAKKSKKVLREDAVSIPVRTYTPSAAGKHSLSALVKLTIFELKSVVKNPNFIIICAIGVINLVASLTSFTGQYGADQYPVTYDVIDTIRGSFYLFLIAIITFYSGVLVWKERDAKVNEIQDAAPVMTGSLFTSKVIAMIITIGLVLAGTIVVGMVAQLCFGYFRLQPDVYIKSLLVIDLLSFAYLVIVAVFFHYVINNRYIAYFAFITFVILNTFIWNVLEVSTNMVDYGNTPSVTYSDMNGFGPFTVAVVWFNTYWSLFALLLCFIAFAFYVRGRETAFMARLRGAGGRLRQDIAWIILVGVVFIACSGFVYYNTKVLNTYDSSKERELQSVDYEKKYKMLEGVPQPRWYKLDYKIDLYPYDRDMSVEVHGWVRNISTTPVSTIYFNLPDIADSIQLVVPGGTAKLNDKRLKFRAVQLSRPMRPGDSLQLVVKFKTETKGFENEVSFTEITQNGTFFNSGHILPSMGYDANREMADKNKRKEYKLTKRRRMPVLNEADSMSRRNNYVIHDADWVTVNTVFSTAKDQIAVAPGRLVKDWLEGDRR